MTLELLLYALVGFAAQLVDGALGMGYGVISASALVAAGVPPAVASATVHVTKIPAGLASVFSHWRAGNVDWALARRLIPPGIAGGVIGASAISLAPLHVIRPLAALYLSVMGIAILWRAARPRSAVTASSRRRARVVGFVGGVFDSFGGGWGPIVTSSLVTEDRAPRRTVGSVNAAEPVIAAAQAAVFGAWLGAGVWIAVGTGALGLVLGALLAAPIAARLVRRIPGPALVYAIGAALLGINLPILVQALGIVSLAP